MPTKGGAAGASSASSSQRPQTRERSQRAEFSRARDRPNELEDSPIPDANSDIELSGTQIDEIMNGAADWLGGGGGDVRSLMMGLLGVITQMATQLSWEESAPPPPPSRVSHTEEEILKRLERIEEKLRSTNEGVAATAAAATPAVRRMYAQVAAGGEALY